jgi:hypothetical protein
MQNNAHKRTVHVYQIGDSDCGVAVAAMATGTSYERALELAFPLRELGSRGMYTENLITLLARLTGTVWRKWEPLPMWPPWVFRNPRLEEFRFTAAGPIVLCIISPEHWTSHFIVANEGLIYDGCSNGPMPLGQYERKEWILGGAIFRDNVRIALRVKLIFVRCLAFNIIMFTLFSVTLLFLVRLLYLACTSPGV